ncbi:ATP-dependent RNA helicase glh-1 [Rhynchospora pubera]|uniref:ATP-dependent RNA helicase glh-1 n=1 Tax=Rhynchospora pubera TaxID=906938 RepID=A0AAV8F3P0_9POAL|nr:ATP-dependent RNA helicase glh-1 [Rhynchospora pubera]
MEQPASLRRRGRPRGRERTRLPRGGRNREQGPVEQEDQAVPQANPVPQGVTQEGIAQLLAGLTQLVGQVVRTHVVPDPFTIAYHEFLRHQTPRYDGSGEYEAAEEWLLAIQDTFRLARTPTEHWTELAATRFDKDAIHWWATQQPQYQGGGPSIPWEWFTDVFRARFMGETQQEELRRRFETLTQGAMTARQYGETFLRLSRYAPELVADPRRRRDRFIRGLIPDLASLLDSYQSTSIEFLMDKAMFQEGLLASCVKFRQDQLKSSDGSLKVASQDHSMVSSVTRQSSNATFQQTSTNASSKKKRYFCRQCRRLYNGPCTRHTGRCHLCHSLDHWMKDCPKNKDRPFNNSDFKGSSQPRKPLPSGMVGGGEVNPGRACKRPVVHQRGRRGHVKYGGQFGQDTARVHAIVGQEDPATRTCCQCVCRPDSSG